MPKCALFPYDPPKNNKGFLGRIGRGEWRENQSIDPLRDYTIAHVIHHEEFNTGLLRAAMDDLTNFNHKLISRSVHLLRGMSMK